MKVLIVARHHPETEVSPFVREQAESLQSLGVEVVYFLIRGKGFKGYFNHWRLLNQKLRREHFDLVHGHYGLSGLVATLQRHCPTVVTFHGSDVHRKDVRVLSWLASRLARFCIVVEEGMAGTLRLKKNYAVLPCGVGFDVFYPQDKQQCRTALDLPENRPLVLFAGSQVRKVKNYPLAEAAVSRIPNAQLIELKGYSRHEVCTLINACDVLLLTSFWEGSPQVVKEALACNRPVVATDVGDIRARLTPLGGCYVTSFDPTDVTHCIEQVLANTTPHVYREAVKSLSVPAIASRLLEIYESVLNKTQSSA